MAKNTVTLTLTINKQQAEQKIEELKVSLKEMKDELSLVQNKLNNRSEWDQGDTYEGLIRLEKSLSKQIKITQKDIDNGVRELKGYEEKLNELTELNYNTLTQMRTAYTNSLKNVRLGTQEDLEVYEQKMEALQKIRDEIAKRDIDVRGGISLDKAQTVLAKPEDYSTKEIEEAVAAMTKFRDMKKTDSQEWEHWNGYVQNGKQFLEEFNASVKQSSMEKQLINLPTISDKALADQKRYWQELVNGTDLSSQKLAEYKQKLADVNAEEENRLSRKAGAVMGKLEDYSTAEIEEAIKLTEKLQKAQKPGSAEWTIYGEEIKKAKEYLQGYVDLDKQIDMEDKWSRLPSLSADALAEQKKYWQEMANGAARGSKELQEYQDRLAEVKKEESTRLRDRYEDVLQTPTNYSVSEVQDAIKAFEKLRDEQNTGSMQWKYYNQMVEDAKETMKRFNDEAKESVMSDRLSSIGTASKTSLEEQKKYWQAMVDGAEKGSAALVDYQAKLEQVTAEEKARLQASLSQTEVEQFLKGGNVNKTVGEIKQLVQDYEKFRNMIDATDATALKQVDEVIANLKAQLKDAEQGVMSIGEALNKAENLDSFKGSIEDLEKLKKRLLEIKKTEIDLAAPDAEKKLLDISKALETVEDKITEVNKGAIDLEAILKRPSAYSLEKLQEAARLLERDLHRCAQGTAEFAKKSEDLRKVNKQLDAIKKSFQEQENIILKTAKRLASYVVVYAGFNEIVGKVKELTNLNLQLSDSIADVQKTTGLAGVELQELGKSIEGLDTRTTTTELYQLAAAAGQIGLKSQEDILGFTKAANIISVALNELGAEGSASLMKIAQLTGELANNSTEDALLKIGSAINELTANSAATAGPITDFINRFGGVAASAKITTYEMAALGAATDASAQSAEVAGTSMNKFVNALLANTQSVAYAANISYKELQGLIDSGKTMDAIVLVLERMQTMSKGAQMGLLKELGSEGARMNQYVSSLVANLDLLKEQLSISKTAYEENISVQNEYNVKNESAIGILQRMKNQFVDTFVNSRIVEVLKEILVGISELPRWFEQHQKTFLALKLAVMAFVGMKIPAFLATVTTGFKQLGTLLAGSFVNAWRVAAFEVAVSYEKAGMATDLAIKKTKGLTGAFRVLWGVIKANPLGALVTAVTIAVTVWDHFRKKTDELTKATEELRKKHERESQELEAMRKVMIDSNSSYEDKIRIIKDLNSLYEKYLGFELRILDSYEKKKAALDYINARLKEQHNLEIYNKKVESVTDTFYEDSEGNRDYLEEVFTAIPEIGRKRWPEVMNIINKAIEDGDLEFSENAQENLQNAFKFVNERMGKYFNVDFLKVFGDSDARAWTRLSNELVGYIDDYTTWLEKLEEINQERDAQAKIDQEESTQKLETLANQQKAEIQSLKNTQEEELKLIRENGKKENKEEAKINEEIEAKKQAHQQQLLSQYKDYQATLEKLKQQEQDILDAEISTAIKSGSYDEITKRFGENTAKAADEYQKMTKEVEALQKELNTSTELSEKQRSDKQNELYQKQIEQATLLRNAQTKAAVTVKNVWLDTYKEVSAIIKSTNEDLVGDPYGKADNLKNWKLFAGTIENLKTASPESLVNTFKAIQEESQNISLDGISKFNEMFSTETHKLNFDTSSLENFNKQVKGLAEQIRARLRELGRDTEGNFLWGKGKSKKDKSKEEFKAALAALEAYFNEREALIREKGLKEGKTQSQVDQQLESLKTEKLKDEIELRKLLLDDYYKESTFDPSKYKGVKTGTDYFKEKNLEYLAGLRVQLEKWGVAMEDGMKKQLTDKMDKIAEQALKLREKINKILLEDDFNAKVLNEYLDNLQELGLLFGVAESEISKTSEEEGKRRLAYMQEWSKESHNLTAQQLADKVKQNTLFSGWIIGRTEKDYEVLLSQLQKFHDDQAEADKKQAERRKKIFESSSKGLQLKREEQEAVSSAEIKVKEEEKDVKKWERFRDMDLVSDDTIDRQEIDVSNAQIAVYQAKIDASNRYIEQMRLEMQVEKQRVEESIENIKKELANSNISAERRAQLNADLVAAEQKKNSLIVQEEIITQAKQKEIAEAQQGQVEEYQNISDRYVAIEQRKVSEIKKYTDAIADFSGQMSEAAFGEVEDRKEAAKQLVKNLLTTLKDWATVKITELAMQKMFADQSNAIEGGEMVTNLTASGMEAGATVAVEGVKATAKETGKHGWKGLLIGAAISAALSALLGVAMGALNKKKSEIAQTTGATKGKLATGMLTYAEGNYPVLGNDGQVYNAKYEGENIKTGIYRGGAHFGIFSEKKPEAIIDGDTTQRLIMNHPDIWKAIVTLSKTGRINNSGMRTFATGNINELAKQASDMETSAASASSAEMMQMQATMAATHQALTQLNQILANGISANLNMYGDDGAYKKMKKAEKFASRVGYK